jgi:carbon starvation protein
VNGGTRTGRFMLQDLRGVFAPIMRNIALCVGAWDLYLDQSVTDPLGKVNTLWPLFGIWNPMLAAVELTLCAGRLNCRRPSTRTRGCAPGPTASGLRSLSAAYWRRPTASIKCKGAFNDCVDAALASMFTVVVEISAFGSRTRLGAYRTNHSIAREEGPAAVQTDRKDLSRCAAFA